MSYLIKYKPITPSLRFKCLINKSNLWKGKKLSKLTCKVAHNSGRSRNGHIILYTRSKNYHKKIYRVINFNYHSYDIPFKIYRIEYDPNRSSFINLVLFKNNTVGYFINMLSVKIGELKNLFTKEITYHSKILKKYNSGCITPLKFLPDNTIVSLLEHKPLYGAVYARAAGAYCLLIQKRLYLNVGIVRLRSGIRRVINLDCKATIGRVSNLEYKQISYGKAGRKRWFGIKPNVRGVAMNPIDHPHGGGNGKKSKKVAPRTAWGKIYKWKKTSKRI